MADQLAELLAADGWALGPGADVSLAVIVPPADAGDWADALESTLLAPVRLMQALADAGRPAQVVLVLDHAALVPGCVPAPRLAATAALLAAMKDAALTLAPGLRINALALGEGADPAPSLRWLVGAQAVTGQIIAPGLAPRPPTLWRSPDVSPRS
jgi:NAD(P)-dependent dehydrogenase (short-subunit alcohol dehydrogenase family)